MQKENDVQACPWQDCVLAGESLQVFLDGLAGDRADRGGGTAVLTGAAMGAALLAMAVSVGLSRWQRTGKLPKGVELGADERDVLELHVSRIARARALVRDILNAAHRDGSAYDGVIAAARLPQATPEERAVRARAREDALHHAIQVPLQAAETCLQALKMAPEVLEFVPRAVHSDVLAACRLLRVGVNGCLCNARQNCLSLGSDQDYREAIAANDSESEAILNLVLSKTKF